MKELFSYQDILNIAIIYNYCREYLHYMYTVHVYIYNIFNNILNLHFHNKMLMWEYYQCSFIYCIFVYISTFVHGLTGSTITRLVTKVQQFWLISSETRPI